MQNKITENIIETLFKIYLEYVRDEAKPFFHITHVEYGGIDKELRFFSVNIGVSQGLHGSVSFPFSLNEVVNIFKEKITLIELEFRIRIFIDRELHIKKLNKELWERINNK